MGGVAVDSEIYRLTAEQYHLLIESGAFDEQSRVELIDGLSERVADLETINQLSGDRVDFTLYWPEADRWEGADFVVYIG